MKFTEGGGILSQRKISMGSMSIIYTMKAHKFLARGCEVFFAHAIESIKKIVDLSDIKVVRKFTNVFLNELPVLLPLQEVEFQIDLVSRVAPIAKAPYWLAPSKMKEMWSQLEEL